MSMGWSRRAGFAFGPAERAAFAKVCEEHAVPARLVEELIELEVSEQRNKNAAASELLQQSLSRRTGSRTELMETASPEQQEVAYRIRRLKLGNFCVFADAAISFDWMPDRPLSLVEGNNGYGKTKLIEALRFVLFGPRSETDPISLLHRDAERPRARLEVELELALPGEEEVRLRRFIEFAVLLGEWKVERQVLVARVGKRALQDDEAQEWIDARMPQHVMECFVFDAERSPLAALAEGGSGTGVAEQLERVLGVALLRAVATRVKKAESSWRRELDGGTERKSARQARAGLEEIDAALEMTESQIRDQSNELKQLTDDKSRVVADLNKLLSQFDPAAEEARDRRTARAAALRSTQERVRQDLLGCVGNSLPIQLLSEHISYAGDRSRAALSNARSDSFRAGIEHAVNSIALMAAEGQLPWDEEPKPDAKTIAARLLGALDVPDDPDGMDSDFALSEPTIRQLEQALAETLGLPVPAQLVEELRAIREELAALGGGTDMRSVGASPDLKERHQHLLGEQSDLDKQISRREVALETQRRRREELVAQRHEREQELKRAEEVEDRLSRLREQRNLAARVGGCLRALAEKLRSLRVEALEEGATEMFRKTTNKPELYARVAFDRDTLRYRVCDHEGQTAPLDRSTGERAVLSLALAHGLRRASGRNLPLVVEAPLKPLDPEHADKVIRHAFRRTSQQTILLVKPEEIPRSHSSALLARVGQRFELHRPEPGREVSAIREVSERGEDHGVS